MTLMIRAYRADADTWSYFEVGEDLRLVRQVESRGSAREPVTAADLGEVLWIRDHADRGAMAAYERRYGVLAESDLAGWQDASGTAEITAVEFEEVWAAARSVLRAVPEAGAGAGGERGALIAVLRCANEACEPARAALRSGGDFVVWEGAGPAEDLARVYRSRRRRTRAQGLETLGLDHAVATLEGLGQDPVRLGRIRSSDGGWTFILFLSPDAAELLTCTGVRRRRVGAEGADPSS
ncbi:hypothetical protein [Actinomadura parmotrematis]|uniref:Uncharacterized protein n=1 Tax=Actinomadura parmotrematis TaxID=2864039 RepID=A0ABS7G4M5_9ACTN|nr:hypothetical protein [Actinomadura parmotrematis]MBW8487633.1 hypothetical protein [Actinomadura parmotrematis]